MHVFATLMQERASIASKQSVQALNILDVVFADSPRVREAWADLFNLFETAAGTGIHHQLQTDKLSTLLREMAADLGLSKKLAKPDFARTYFPDALAKQAEVAFLQTKIELRRLREQVGTADEILTRFPPKPGS